ncbi:MAG: dUTP diphosphatase [Gammaproteobacteria bacterium]|nr:dUTP diphosphatase [Gammaproteobacteria bacterium]
MIRLQLLHNCDVHPSWDTQGYPFYRAIWTECSELLDHFGWKWWKHQETDLEQVKLEIVDIWHFGLSMIVIEDRSINQVAMEMTKLQSSSDALDFREAVESLARNALEGSFEIECFMKVLNATPMTLNELYGIYKGKHVLNRFRQANGYKEGSYLKEWNGREDNVHLAALVRGLNAFSDDFQSDLEQALNDSYLGAFKAERKT